MASAFASPAQYSMGNGTPTESNLRNPGTIGLDSVLSRSQPIRKSMKIQVRVKIYDILNHPNLGTPSVGITSSTFGQITTKSGSRTIPLALSLNFRHEDSCLTMRVRGIIAACVLAATACAQNADPNSLTGKVLLGYQGWFRCPAGGVMGSNWSHWANGVLTPSSVVVDMYPDMREFAPGEACAIPNMTIGQNPAYLFSSANSQTVARHFRWMQQYGLDGVLAQRFVTDIPGNRAAGDPVLKNVMAAAEKFGRVFAIEYDVTGANQATVVNDLQQDWNYLVNTLHLTESPEYLRHGGKPVVSIWGMGFSGGRNPPENPAVAAQVVQWFRSTAGVMYIGGTPSGWRTLSSDALTDPGWSGVYQTMDVIQPWTVGRYANNSGADSWLTTRIKPDLTLTEQNHQLYMPVIFPGFSWHNLTQSAAGNQIPRNGGVFLWRQAYNAKAAGAQMLKIAMFDEVNESTAVFKVASRRQDAPDQGYWLTLDADGFVLPSDWYLRLAGEITRMFHSPAPPSSAMPSAPGPPWAGEAAMTLVSAASFADGAIAADSLVTATGTDLGSSISVIDSSGWWGEAQVSYASATQVNFALPAGLDAGPATILSTDDAGKSIAARVNVAVVAPGIFTATGNGKGVAAGVVVVREADGQQRSSLTFACSAPGDCQPVPVEFGGAGGEVILELFGTGVRGRSALSAVTCTIGDTVAPVVYAGPQNQYAGLDQVNVAVPRTLSGVGLVPVQLAVDGKAANRVDILFR